MTSDPALPDLVEVAGVLWPRQLLERAPAATLETLAGTLAGEGACRMCGARLGEQPWVAVVDAAAGPFGAWVARGGLAHPECAAHEVVWGVAGEREEPVPTSRRATGMQRFPIPASTHGWNDRPAPSQQIAFPTLSLTPSIDTFLIGADPGSTRVEDQIMRRFLDRGWHHLRRGVIEDAALDLRPPHASITLEGNRATLQLADGGTWDFEIEEPRAILSLGCVVVLIGVTSWDDERVDAAWLFPGPLYAVVFPREHGEVRSSNRPAEG